MSISGSHLPPLGRARAPHSLQSPRVIVVGAGIGGLAVAMRLAARGVDVLVLERDRDVGGKARTERIAGFDVDAGPTVVTMRWALDEVFQGAGARLDEHVRLEPRLVLARHAWSDGTRFDLFADPARALDEVGRVFGPRERAAYAAFRDDARRIYESVEAPFLRAPAPTLRSVLAEARRNLGALTRIDALRSMMSALEARFSNPKLTQLFGRYATYCGSSPYEAPATLNLVSHVEAMGVYRVHGGVGALAQAMRAVAAAHGATFRHEATVVEVVDRTGQARGVRLANGEEFAADAVVFNGDVAALAGMTTRRAVASHSPQKRSFSAVTWTAVARASGFPLVHHNVFFSDDYRTELEALVRDRRVHDRPTVYLCAQDRGDEPRHLAEERMLLIVNAPATGDDPERWQQLENERCDRAAFQWIERCGLTLENVTRRRTTPREWNQRVPATGGALYGPISSGSTSAMMRHGSSTKLPGLFMAGGSVHPGPGVPMAALSGTRAAEATLAYLASTARSRPAGIAGTTSTA